MKTINFLVVGTNFISDNFCEAAKSLVGVSVYAVYSRKFDTGREFAHKHGIEKVYTNYEEALLDNSVDAVYVASPTFLHAEHSVKAMRAKKHVLCEKSIASSLSLLDEMIEVSKEEGVVLLEAMRPAFDTGYKVIKEALESIGTIRRASLQFCKYSTRYDKFKAGIVENAFDPVIKNSALSDIGVYPLWLSVALFGEPREVKSKKIFLENGFLAAGISLLDYGDMYAEVSYSKISEESTPSFIEGERGTVIIDKISEMRKIYFKPIFSEPELIYENTHKNNMVFEISAFEKAVRGSFSHSDQLALSRLVMKIADSIHEH